jgi:tetratricopeptide (TPR) repeat protein
MEQVRTELYKIDMNNSDEILKFYKKHKLYYENLNKAIDKMTIEEFILVKQKYLVALEKQGKYSEASTVLEQVCKLLDRLKNKKSKYYSDFYEKALFYEGLLLGRQEKYAESNEIFKKLIGIDSKNERYQNWYLTNKEWLAKKKISIFEYFVIATFLITILWGNKIFADNMFIVRLVVFILFVILLVIKQFYRKFIKLPNPEIQQNNTTNA